MIAHKNIWRDHGDFYLIILFNNIHRLNILINILELTSENINIDIYIHRQNKNDVINWLNVFSSKFTLH